MPGLRVVDGLSLDEAYRKVLQPGYRVTGRDGKARRLPRWFYEIPSWEVALETQLAPSFKVWEFLNVDVREHELQRLRWPRYLPMAVGLLASALEVFRAEVNTYVHVAANGGYRSPAHRLSGPASPHFWGTAVNLYRVGDDWLDDEKNITRYARVAKEVLPAFFALPYGHGLGQTDDHLHLDIGYVTVAPHDGASEENDDAKPLQGGDADDTETRDG